MSVVVANASKWYGNVVAVNDVSFELHPGITGLLGPNGAGKSTILHLMAGLLRPSSGTIAIDGITAWAHPAIYRTLGFVAESERTYDFLTGRQLVDLSAALAGVSDLTAATARAIALVELDAAQDRPIATYSKGMRQRAKVAAALVHSPRVLLLDEPFNGMDPRQRMQMMALLRRLASDGATVLVSSHILEEIDHLADSVLVLLGGRLAASGSSREIRQLMTDRPHTFTLRSSDNRSLAAALVRLSITTGVELAPDALTIRTADLGAFTRALPALARDAGVSLDEVIPTDESLESVFAYLVES